MPMELKTIKGTQKSTELVIRITRFNGLSLKMTQFFNLGYHEPPLRTPAIINLMDISDAIINRIDKVEIAIIVLWIWVFILHITLCDCLENLSKLEDKINELKKPH